VKINSILALDSLDGKRIPSIEEISTKIEGLIAILEQEPGITNVHLDADYSNYMFKLSCDFNSLEELQDAIRSVVRAESKDNVMPELNHNWLSLKDNKLSRSVPQITIKKSKEINTTDRELLKAGSYTSITRFEKEIIRFENDKAKVSANKKAIMIRTNPYSLTQNPNLLDNTIYLKEAED